MATFSFTRRKKQIQVRKLLRRLTDLTSPNRTPTDGEARTDSRHNRTLPVLLAPWENGGPVRSEATTALTKNFSDQGVALVLHQPFHARQVVVGMMVPSPDPVSEAGDALFALGEVRQNVPLGGGYWQLGVELTEQLDPARSPELEPLLPLGKVLVPRRCCQSAGP